MLSGLRSDTRYSSIARGRGATQFLLQRGYGHPLLLPVGVAARALVGMPGEIAEECRAGAGDNHIEASEGHGRKLVRPRLTFAKRTGKPPLTFVSGRTM